MSYVLDIYELTMVVLEKAEYNPFCRFFYIGKMKKLILLLQIFPVVSFGQVQVQNNSSTQAADFIRQNSQNAISKMYIMMDNQHKRGQDGAARVNVMSPARQEIKVPLTADLNSYTTIALVGVTYVHPSGKKSSNRGTYKNFEQLLLNSPFTILNPATYNKKKFRKNSRFLRDIKNHDWLYLYFRLSDKGVNSIKSIVVRNSQNRIIYNASTTNVTLEETLSPIVDF